jgi:adenylate cyclase
MTAQEVKRKLTAILSADVKGYTRLIAKDEAGTLQTLNTYKEAMVGLIQHHHGRVVDAPGDNLLAEFASVVDAVQCAVEIQKELRARNDKLPIHRKMEFRIGINLGDVVEEEDKIFGDGVNIAARMQSLADGGSICISGTVYEHIKNKLTLRYEYLGKQRIKNIVGPVKVYRVMIEPETLVSVVSRWKRAGVNYWKRIHPAFKILVALVAAGNALWQLYPRSISRPVEVTPKDKMIEVASREKMAFPLPDKPSIAVLPFVNMSGDKEQEYFSDGITEEIITALSKVPDLFVISRQSTFTYKGKAVKVKQVSEELGVRYVLEGSVRKESDKVRITAQLIDALSGHHLWAERYDRDLKNIFALQDEITMKIITALQVKLTAGELATLWAKGTKNLEAYLKYMEAFANYSRQTKEGNALAKKLAEEVIALDPNYPRGYILLAQTHLWDILLGTTESHDQSMAKATELGKKALALDDSETSAHGMLGAIYVMSRQYDKAIAQVERTISLNPNSWDGFIRYGFILLNSGRPEEAIPVFKNARRLNPSPSQFYFLHIATAYRLTGRYEEAIETAKEGLRYVPNNVNIYLQLTATYSMMGREEDARTAATEVMKINPKFSLVWYAKTLYFKNKSDVDKTLEALRKAGLK